MIMSVLRKLIVIILLIVIIFSLQFFQTSNIINAETLISLGFILLAGFSFGELTNLIGLTRIPGYLISGIVFGPYSDVIFQTHHLNIFSDTAISDLKLVKTLAISLIALVIGNSISLKDLKEGKKTITLIILFQVLLITIPVFLLLLLISPYYEIFKFLNFNYLLLFSLIVSVFMISTSPDITMAVINESGESSKLSKYILNISVLKEIIFLVLISVILGSINYVLPSETEGFNNFILSSSLQGILLSFVLGILSGILLIIYSKYAGKEKLIVVLAFVLFANEIASLFQLNILITFITTGFVIKNFSKPGKDFINSIEKLSLPVYCFLFTITGAELNLNLISLAIQLAVIIFLARIILMYASTKLATKISGEELDIQNNSGFGFVSQSLISLSFIFLITSPFTELNEILISFLMSIITLNILFGPPLFNFAISNLNRTWNKKLLKQDKKFEEKVKAEAVPYRKFNVPDFENNSLNELIISLREKLISHLQEFENLLINKRSEESFEYYYQIVEKYIDEYQQLKNIFTKGKISGKEIKEKVFLTQQEISEWFARISVQRKSVEQQILNAEYLLQKLFDDLKEYCENAPEFIVVEQEQDKYEKELDDNFFVKSIKYYKRFDKRIRKFLGIKTGLKRTIPYITLVKYYFEYQIALEMEKVAFFLGLERLNVLRKVKKIYDDVTTNLEELINLVSEHKDVEAISLLAIDKLNEIHDRLKQEISSIGEEIELSNKNITTRLNYAFANPFNQFLRSILKAGTIELNIKKFHFSKIYSETNKAKEITLETIRFWVNYLLGFLGVCERDARIFEITGKINSLINDTMINHSDIINSHIRNLISELNTLFKNFENEISDKNLLKSENLFKIKNHIASFRDEIIHILNEKGISKLTLLKKSYSIINTINSIKDQFASIIKEYDKEIKVLDEQDFELKETRTKYIELKTLHFTEIIKNYFENEILQEIIKLNEIISGHLSSSILELKNIENIIYYHFNIAIDELNKLETDKANQQVNYELQKIIDDTLKSSIKLLREKIKVWDRQIEKFKSEIEVSLTEKIYSQISKIKESFRKELTAELEKRIELKKYQLLLKKLVQHFGEIKQQLRKLIVLSKRKTNQILKPLIREVKEFLEFDLEGKSILIYSYDQTVYDEKVYNSLPFIYKKLFDYTSSDIVEILVGREKEKNLLNQAFERNLRGLSGSTAIIGESGTGKSSLISSFLSKLQTDANIYRYNFDKTIRSEKELLSILSEMLEMKYIASFDEIISELNLSPDNKIIILEDIHKIYLRKFNGLEAMKKLLLIISETSNKIFWIVSISYHAWQLLNRILNIGNFFPFQIKTEVLSKEKIQEAILKRHKTSGYNLEFLPEEEFKIHKQLKYSLLTQDRQNALMNDFFDRLYEACEGNITSALFYWVKSIKEFKNDTIYINPLKKLDFRFLETFEIDKLLTLSNLIQHGSLTIKEHQEIFKCDEEKSKAILNFLNTANLIHFDMNDKGEKVYYINSAVYKNIEIELRKLHIFE